MVLVRFLRGLCLGALTVAEQDELVAEAVEFFVVLAQERACLRCVTFVSHLLVEFVVGGERPFVLESDFRYLGDTGGISHCGRFHFFGLPAVVGALDEPVEPAISCDEDGGGENPGSRNPRPRLGVCIGEEAFRARLW